MYVGDTITTTIEEVMGSGRVSDIPGFIKIRKMGLETMESRVQIRDTVEYGKYHGDLCIDSENANHNFA